ncbi:MAG: transporter substrate-binding domain-containing protein, partial [Pseudomonadota bacterium]
ANISITSARERVLDFSQPMFDAGLKVMTPEEGQSVGLFGALFNLEMLGLVALSFLLLFGAANAMWYFEHKTQPYFQYPYREGVFRSFWWALNVIVNGGFEERIPLTPRGRVFAIFLVFASLFIVSAFVAKITATLTVGELQSQIRGYTDLYGKRVGTTQGSTASAFLESHAIDHTTYTDIDTLFAAVADRKLDAVVHDAPLLDYYAATRGRNRVRVVGDLLRPEKFGIALQQDSPLAERVNRALLNLKENGEYERLRARWFER